MLTPDNKNRQTNFVLNPLNIISPLVTVQCSFAVGAGCRSAGVVIRDEVATSRITILLQFYSPLRCITKYFYQNGTNYSKNAARKQFNYNGIYPEVETGRNKHQLEYEKEKFLCLMVIGF